MKDAYPTGRFWIKADGCDVKPALQQSVKGVWNRDADLGDGNLLELRSRYEERMKDIKNLASLQDNVKNVLVELDKVATNLEDRQEIFN